MCVFWWLLIVERLPLLRLIRFESSSLQSKQHTFLFFFLDSTSPMDSLCPTGQALLIILWAQHRVNTLTFYTHITDPLTSVDLCPRPHKTFMFLFVYVEPAGIKRHSVSPLDL